MAAALLRAAAMAPNIRAMGDYRPRQRDQAGRASTPRRPPSPVRRELRSAKRSSPNTSACVLRPPGAGGPRLRTATRNMQGSSRSPVPASRPQHVKGTSTYRRLWEVRPRAHGQGHPMVTAGESCAACARTLGPQVGGFHVKLAHQTLRHQHCARAARGRPAYQDGDKKRLRQPRTPTPTAPRGSERLPFANRMDGCDGCISSTAGAGRLLAVQSTGVPAQPACSARCLVRSGTAARRPPNGAGKGGRRRRRPAEA
jgi:hypothetical protein